jgi:hypothetical protein
MRGIKGRNNKKKIKKNCEQETTKNRKNRIKLGLLSQPCDTTLSSFFSSPPSLFN